MQLVALKFTVVILVNPRNSNVPILVTAFGIETEVSPEQPRNALPPMLITELGIVTEDRPEHP